jgi:hypothetical protein
MKPGGTTGELRSPRAAANNLDFAPDASRGASNLPVRLPDLGRGILARSALCLIALLAPAAADSVKPLFSGPFFLNQISMVGSPAGYDYVLTNGFYHFQVGWIEPIAQGHDGLFGETYFETNGNLNVSPFTSDIGTTFNLKPIRYLEIGLSYNRMLFHNSMVGFVVAPEQHVPKQAYRPNDILTHHKEPGGADIFTYHANATFDWGPAQFYFSGSRTLWDIDAKGKDYVFEYGDDLLLNTRDRVNNLMAQVILGSRPHRLFLDLSFIGVALRDQYWLTDDEGLEKNLVSLGITGLRSGRNPQFQRRGLDLSLGYWTLHNQVPSGAIAKSLMIIADWQWNIHVLKI